MQAVVRMFLVRVNMDEGLLSTRIALNHIADAMIHEEVAEYFIPDLLIEILTEQETELKPISESDRQASDLYNIVEREVVMDLAGKIVQGEINRFVQGYLSNVPGRLQPQHPLWDLVDFLIEDWLPESVTEVVEEVVGELVEGHLFNQKFEAFMNEALEPIIHDIAGSALTDVYVGGLGEAFLEEALHTEIAEVVEELKTELQQQFVSEQQQQDEEEVAVAADQLIHSASLKLLAQTMATNGDDLLVQGAVNPPCFLALLLRFIQGYLQQMYDTMMAKQLIDMISNESEQHAATAGSVVVSGIHTEIVAQKTFVVLLGEVIRVMI
jgi:hypothetical protein